MYGTLFSDEVDVCVELTGTEEVGNLSTAVKGRVEYTQSSPPTNACVQHGCLDICSLSLRQFVIMLYLNS